MNFISLILFFSLLLNFTAFSDWIPNYNYQFLNYAKKTNQPLGVAVIAFNRPEYLEKLIESIERNKQSQELPVFFFLDGGPYAKIEENITLINQSKIRNKFIIQRDINYGINKNFVDSQRFMFDWCNFERVIMIEEDMKLSDNYFTTLLDLDDWAHKTYDNIGTTQLWSYCRLTQKQKEKNLNLVRQVKPQYSFVTFCISKKTWADICPFLYEFERKFIDPLLGNETMFLARSKLKFSPYEQEIKVWVQNILNLYSTSSGGGERKISSLISAYKFDRKAVESGNYDEIMAFLIWIQGYARLQSVVNRSIHIGNVGFTEINDRFNDIYLDEFEIDVFQHNFQYVSKEPRYILFLKRNILDNYGLYNLIYKKR